MNRTLILGIGLGAFLFTACADDRPLPSGGGSVQPGEKISGLYVANSVDDDSITRVDLDTGVLRQIQLGKEPTRIARIGGRVYVSLRNERAVAVLEEDGNDLKNIGRIQTGAEPYGIAATVDRVYIASSMSGTVDEYDAASFEKLRTWKIAGEPRWVSIHPSGASIYVGSAYGGIATRIHLSSGVATRIALPRIQGFNFIDGSSFEFSQRITGDIAVAPNGKSIYVPMMYIDNKSSIPNVEDLEEGEDPCQARREPDGMGGGFTPPPGSDCGGGGYNSSQRFNPVVTKVPVNEVNGEADVDQFPEAIQIVASGQVVENGGVVGFEQFASYPAAAAVSPDSTTVFAVMEGSAVMVAFSADFGDGSGASVPRPMNASDAAPGIPGGSFGFSFRNVIPVRTGAAPRGVAVVGDKVYVHAFFDRVIEEIELGQIQELIHFGSTGVFDRAVDAFNSDGSLRVLRAGNARVVNTRELAPEIDAGRRLFYAANNPMMVTVGAGISCATCHFEGRTDGITYTFDRGVRQVPNLSVNLVNTLPVGWAGNVASVADEGFNTSQKLMGGTGLSRSHAGQIESYLYSLRTIDPPARHVANDAVARGAAIFSNVGCTNCHTGLSFTDGKTYNMLDFQGVQTPALVGVSGSAPFMHNGMAESLEDVVDLASRGVMGEAFAISLEQKADLVAFLKSL